MAVEIDGRLHGRASKATHSIADFLKSGISSKQPRVRLSSPSPQSFAAFMGADNPGTL